MDKPPFRELLRKAMERAGVSQRELSRRSGKNISTISLTLQGKTWGDKYPPLDDIEAYARALDLDPALLRGDDLALMGPAPEPPPEIQTAPIAELLRRVNARPAYGDRAEDLKASAGTRKGSVPQGYDDSRLRKRLGQQDLPARIQLIEVEGDCMAGILAAGDIVHVDIEQTPEIGDVVAAMRFYDELIVKFLREQDGHQYFASRDGTVTIPFDQYTRILGPVIDVQRSIKRILAEL